MQMLPRKKGRRDNIFLFSILILFNVNLALASQELVYKDIRPRKSIFDDKDGIIGAKKKEVLKGYLYDPSRMTDPFKSFIAIREEREVKERKKPRTYLETLDLSSLHLSVIVIGPTGKWAMVQDSKGLGHVIKKGTAIGTNGGVVFDIKAGEVVIREEYRDFRGRKKFRNISKQ